MKSKRYAEALEALRYAATLNPKNPSVHYQIFIALQRLKQKDQADQELLIFKQLEEERKAQSQPGDDMELENPEPPAPPP